MIFIRTRDDRFTASDGTWAVTRNPLTGKWSALHRPDNFNAPAVSILASRRIPDYDSADDAICAVLAGKYPTR